MSETPKMNETLKGMLEDLVGKARAEGFEEGIAKGYEKDRAKGAPVETRSDEEPKHDPLGTVVRSLRYLRQANNDVRRAKDIADRQKDFAVVKAMGESTLGGGGALVSGAYAPEIIPALQKRSVIRSSGVTTGPLPQGGLTMGYGDTDASASYTVEATAVNESSPTTGVLQFTPRTLTCVGAVSDDLLQDSSGRADAMIRASLVRAIATAENAQLIRGTGSPISLRQLAIANSNTTTSAGTTAANVTTDLTRLVKYVENQDVFVDSGGFLMSHTTKWAMMALRDGNNNLVFGNEMAQGRLMGFPFQSTTHVPQTGSDGELYFANFGDLLLLEVDGIEMDVFPGGAYANSSGTVVAGISTRQTPYRVVLRHDFNARFRGKEVSLITSLSY